MTQIKWALAQLTRRLWFRAALFALAGVASALVSVIAAPIVPPGFSAKIGADAVDKVLGIIASSMLTVAIFSLSTMVAAYGAAASSATPRATQLLQSDAGAQNALGTFIGAFLFSLVGIISLSTGLYGSSGRVVLFAVTLVVVAVVVTTFVGWIDRLSRLGRMNETIDRVAEAAARALTVHAAKPAMGAVAARPIPERALPIVSGTTGYVQHIDIAALAGLCEASAGEIDVAVRPGSFVGAGDVIAHASGLGESEMAAVPETFVIGERRSFDQDPRFGLIVLSEIASRALSPAVNDPGTAIDVLSALARLLTRGGPASEEPGHPRLFAPTIDPGAMLEDCFVPIARDGAAIVEVALRLQRILAVVAGNPTYTRAARQLAQGSLERALAALPHEQDRVRLRQAAAGSA